MNLEGPKRGKGIAKSVRSIRCGQQRTEHQSGMVSSSARKWAWLGLTACVERKISPSSHYASSFPSGRSNSSPVSPGKFNELNGSLVDNSPGFALYETAIA